MGRFLAVAVTLLGLGITVATASESLVFHPVPFAEHHNERIGLKFLNPPLGDVVLGEVPFSIPPNGPNFWRSYATGQTSGTLSFDVSVDVFGVRQVHTLLNTDWGQAGPSSYAAVEFFGSDAAYYRLDLMGNNHIRDHGQDRYTNAINGSTTVLVHDDRAPVNPNVATRIDKQAILLPDSFSDEFLVKMRFIDTGRNEFQRLMLFGITAAAEPSTVIDIADGFVRQADAGFSSIGGTDRLWKVGAGTLLLDRPNTLAGETGVIGGEIVLGDRLSLANSVVAVRSEARLAIANGVRALVEGLSLSPAGKVDLGTGSFTVASGFTAETAKAELLKGRGDSSWNGTSGITSTVAAAEIQAGIVRSVGWKTNADDSVTVAYAAPGDTNLDGEVNVFDLVNVSGSGTYGRGNPSNWSQGDFDYNGVTNIFDMVQTNGAAVYGRGNYLPAASPSVNAVPEPTVYTIALVSLAFGGRLVGQRRGRRQSILTRCLVVAFGCVVALCVKPTWAQFVDYELVPVGDNGNAADTTGYGSVPYEYEIGKYEVTIGQYMAFLNAVARVIPNSLWSANMSLNPDVAGIARLEVEGSYVYSLIGPYGVLVPGANDAASRPVTHVTWGNAARFANWMSNGRPSGTLGPTTTEDGAYNLSRLASGVAPAANTVNPNTGIAPLFRIPTEDEWYKAAYFKGGSTEAGYWSYATQSDEPPGNLISEASNQANYKTDVYSVTQASIKPASQNYLTEVGAFRNSASYYGTFDQNGNVSEWNDLDGSESTERGIRGGSYATDAVGISSSARSVTSNIRFDARGLRLVSAGAVISVSESLLQTQAEAGFAMLSGNVPVSKIGQGTVVLDAANNFSLSLFVNEGTVLASNSAALGAATLNVAFGAAFAIAPDLGPLNAVRIERLGTITGALDVGVGRVTLEPSAAAADSVKGLLVAGRNGGGWDGVAGIASTTAAAALQNGIVRSVGWKSNSDGSLTVAYAAPGDTNLDGEVNVFDLVNVSGSGTYGRGNPSNWSQGDFDYNGVTNIFDMVQTNGAAVYGRGNYLPAAPPSVNAVPEPSGWLLALAGLAAGAGLWRRR